MFLFKTVEIIKSYEHFLNHGKLWEYIAEKWKLYKNIQQFSLFFKKKSKNSKKIKIIFFLNYSKSEGWLKDPFIELDSQEMGEII